MINKDGGGGGQFIDFKGDTAVMRGDIELMAGAPSPSPGKTLTPVPKTFLLEKQGITRNTSLLKASIESENLQSYGKQSIAPSL